MIDDLVWCNVVWNTAERNKGEQTFTSFSGMSFLYTCKAVELLLVVEIKLEGKEYFYVNSNGMKHMGAVFFLNRQMLNQNIPKTTTHQDRTGRKNKSILPHEN